MFELYDPTEDAIKETYGKVRDLITYGKVKKQPAEKFLLVHCFVGHGTMIDGAHQVFLNQANSE